MKNLRFNRNCPLSEKRYGIGLWLLWITNWKLCVTEREWCHYRWARVTLKIGTRNAHHFPGGSSYVYTHTVWVRRVPTRDLLAVADHLVPFREDRAFDVEDHTAVDNRPTPLIPAHCNRYYIRHAVTSPANTRCYAARWRLSWKRHRSTPIGWFMFFGWDDWSKFGSVRFLGAFRCSLQYVPLQSMSFQRIVSTKSSFRLLLDGFYELSDRPNSWIPSRTLPDRVS